MATLVFKVLSDDLTSEFVTEDLKAIADRGPIMVGDRILAVFMANQWWTEDSLCKLRIRIFNWTRVKILVDRRTEDAKNMFPTNADLMALDDGPDRKEDMTRTLQRIRVKCLGPEQPEDLVDFDGILFEKDMVISSLEAKVERLDEIISNLRAQNQNDMDEPSQINRRKKCQRSPKTSGI